MSHIANQPPTPTELINQHEQDAKDLTRILPASQKVYIQGSQDDIRVPFREIALTDTPIGLAQGGKKDGFIKNEPILVYDFGCFDIGFW